MHILAFDKKEDYVEALSDNTYYITDYPTPLNSTLKKHYYAKWNPDFTYAILCVTGEEHLQNPEEVGVKFNGKKLVVSENSENSNYWPNLIDVADIYVRHQTIISSSLEKIRFGPYYPWLKSKYTILREIEDQPKKLDVFFSGTVRLGNSFTLQRVEQACRKLKLDYKIAIRNGKSMAYSREKFIEMIAKTRLIINMQANGSRNWREWFAMLGGCMLFQHPGLKGYPFTMLKEGVNFEYLDFYNITEQLKYYLENRRWEAYAGRNKKLGWDCFLQAPTIDTRVAAVHLFGDYGHLMTYEDVECAEKEIFGCSL